MANQEQSRTPTSQPNPGKKSGPVVGSDVPDESKERHTEIAVEVGRKDGEHQPDDKP